MRILIIDGNYFANRCLGILNQGDNKNDMKTIDELDSFQNAMKVQLVKIWNVFNPFFDDFIFVTDSPNSWRREIGSFKPYYVSDEDIENGFNIDYKGIRKKQKEDSSIDYKNFNKEYRNFIDKWYQAINAINVNRLEGDDIIKLVSDKLKSKDIESCIFSTDNDLTQILNSHTFMFSNTNNKQMSMSGKFILSSSTYNTYLNRSTTILDKLVLSHDDKLVNFNDMMGINIMDYQTRTPRQLNNGIYLSEPYKVILTKIVCGDKSDNILPIIRWKSKTNKDKSFSVTERMICKAFDDCFMNFTDDSCKQVIEDPTIRKDFIMNLILECKQNTNIYQDVMRGFDHNNKMVYITPSFMPEESIRLFDDKFSKINLRNGLETITLKELMDLDNIQINDKATNILKQSIPDIEDF